jgi:hypothetical protein
VLYPPLDKPTFAAVGWIAHLKSYIEPFHSRLSLEYRKLSCASGRGHKDRETGSGPTQCDNRDTQNDGDKMHNHDGVATGAAVSWPGA